ncbi:MAG TPA: ammonium transporter [Pirellulales bacterium]|nr:ammonium transporter [Pirellulales bacterium]
MSLIRSFVLGLSAAAISLTNLASTNAQDSIATAQESTAAPAAPVLDHGDNAWMLVSSALVLLMTAPGLAMFYGGLVRKKNVLSVIMQCVFLMALNTVLWGLYGYSLSFGGDPKSDTFNPWIGNDEFLFMRNVAPTSPTDYPLEGTIPRLTHMLFQGMFFIITPALICGAFAERMKFSAMVAFMVLWDTVVYCPLCHWVWDGGILAYGSSHAIFPALDFAGGTVVHISSGVSALVCALVIGKRVGYGHDPMPPHNLAFTTLGAALLWVGWFGFNAGSALAANGQAASAFTATHFAAAAAALAWAAAEWITRGKPTVLGTCSGAVAGLVCITPASGYVQPVPALIMGAAAGLVCCGACLWLKSKLGYDDSLDAFGVHAVGGTLGAVLTGVFATKAVFGTEPLGLLEQGPLLRAQLGATAVSWALAAGASVVLLKLVDVTIGLRVSQEDEMQGVDLSQHGEEGYIFV